MVLGSPPCLLNARQVLYHDGGVFSLPVVLTKGLAVPLGGCSNSVLLSASLMLGFRNELHLMANLFFPVSVSVSEPGSCYVFHAGLSLLPLLLLPP